LAVSRRYLKIGQATFAALAGDYSHPWAIGRFATSAVIAPTDILYRPKALSSGDDVPPAEG
jgi:hypothetical protein